MTLSVMPPEGNAPRVDPNKMRDALSHRVRIEIVTALQKRGKGTLETLQKDLGGDLLLDDLKYHVGVLNAAGCFEAPEPGRVAEPVVYQLKEGLLLDPDLLDHTVGIEDQESLVYDWLEIEVDRIGMAQVLEIMRITRLQFQMTEDQSRGRHEVAGEKLTALVVGVVGFYPRTSRTKR